MVEPVSIFFPLIGPQAAIRIVHFLKRARDGGVGFIREAGGRQKFGLVNHNPSAAIAVGVIGCNEAEGELPPSRVALFEAEAV